MSQMLKTEQKLSYLQLKYLLALDEMGFKRGFQTKIAGWYGVTPSLVSHFMRNCVQAGYLKDESYRFTESGRDLLERHKEMVARLEDYLTAVGVLEKDLEATVASMVDNMDRSVLELMLQNHEKQMIQPRKLEYISGEFPLGMAEGERHQIAFAVYRIDLTGEARHMEYSMAQKGFEEEAWLVKEDGRIYIELTIREMREIGHGGREMVGHLGSIKYENDGSLISLPIVDGRLRIPLSACRLHTYPDDEIAGMIPITVTCSVGEAHMPESTALFSFWC